MKRSAIRTLFFMVVLTSLLMGCASQEEGPVLLQVSGAVAEETGYSEQDLRDLGTLDVAFTEKSGDVSTYNGVLITDVLEVAGLNADASGVVFVGDDSYEAEATLEEVQGCADCIIAFLDEGSLQIVMPGFSSKNQVKDVVEIRAK